MSEDINENKRNCIVGIPRYHENLFEIIKNNHDWLAETEPYNPKNKVSRSYRRKIMTPQDLDKINKIIQDLRDVKSELFIDPEFHRKPRYVSIPNYISEFLRIKGIFNYYTFTSWYRITIFPESGDEECKDGGRREILLIPLYIRLKKNKTYEQLKSIHYINDSGTEYEVKPVNAKHFLRDDSGKVTGIDDGQPQGYDNVTNPKFIVDYNNFDS